MLHSSLYIASTSSIMLTIHYPSCPLSALSFSLSPTISKMSTNSESSTESTATSRLSYLNMLSLYKAKEAKEAKQAMKKRMTALEYRKFLQSYQFKEKNEGIGSSSTVETQK